MAFIKITRGDRSDAPPVFVNTAHILLISETLDGRACLDLNDRSEARMVLAEPLREFIVRLSTVEDISLGADDKALSFISEPRK